MQESYNNPSFIVSPPGSYVQIGLAFTKNAFEHARQQRVTAVSVNPDILRQLIGTAKKVFPPPVLLPTMLVVRDGQPSRQIKPNWDVQLPRYADDPDPGYFISPEHLEDPSPFEVTREHIALAARAIGAAALIEVTIGGWQEHEQPAHAGAVMSAMISGKRPLEPPATSSAGKFLIEAVTPFTAQGRAAAWGEQLKKASTRYPAPFTITIND